MNRNENIVIAADQYDRIDGRNAYRSDVKRITLGAPMRAENESMQIAAQLWKENSSGEPEVFAELPVHQIMDLMILLARTLQYFGEAYQVPGWYDKENPQIDKVGIQGDYMAVNVCTDNPDIDEEIKKFSQAISDLGEITGDRLRALNYIMKQLECF